MQCEILYHVLHPTLSAICTCVFILKIIAYDAILGKHSRRTHNLCSKSCDRESGSTATPGPTEGHEEFKVESVPEATTHMEANSKRQAGENAIRSPENFWTR